MNQPSATIDLTQDGQSREIKMSFGMLNHLARLVGVVDNVPAIATDPDLQSAIMQVVLAKRSEKGKILEPIDLDEVDMSIDDVRAILDWVSEHLFDFFLKGLEKAKQIIVDRKDQLKNLNNLENLMPTSTGSPS